MRRHPNEEREGLGGQIKIEAKSIASSQHPERNEDAHFDDAERGIFGVFDGVGGAAAGDRASRLARESAQRSLRGVSEKASLEEATEAVRQALLEANRAVLEQRKKEGNDMASTASVGMIWTGPDGKRKAIVGNAGDSRVYLIRNGKLQQITIDDNMARMSAGSDQRARELQAKLNNIVDTAQLSPEEREIFKKRNIITKYMGIDGLEPNIHVIDLEPADRLFVCSDGISDNLTDTEIEKILNANPDAQTATKKLVEAAHQRSGSDHARAKPDDISGMVIEMPGTANPGGAPAQIESPASGAKSREASLVGGTVTVVRTGGRVQKEGWILASLEGGKARVVSRENGQNVEKVISETTFRLWQLTDRPVAVKRTSGQMENDWKIARIDGEKVLVQNQAQGVEKTVSGAELLSWQAGGAPAEAKVEAKVRLSKEDLKIGNSYAVKRTSGQIENDWVLARIDGETVLVQNPAQQVEKNVSIAEFLSWQS